MEEKRWFYLSFAALIFIIIVGIVVFFIGLFSGGTNGFKIVSQGMESAIEQKGNYVITDQKDFETIWSNAGIEGKAKEVDFSKKSVIAVFLGNKEGESNVKIEKVEGVGGNLHVFVKEIVPGEKCIGNREVRPYEIVEIPKTEGSYVLFDESRKVKEC